MAGSTPYLSPSWRGSVLDKCAGKGEVDILKLFEMLAKRLPTRQAGISNIQINTDL
ncbi:hypothetical protein [Olivibacter sitiensis]|uniref:hypothetical protein n=1 Tax=Olivibacter sitiensis TaxID=376470 RepID=UPI00146FC113|nr:hypothetical protein [Olivibacter sitiensis]